MSGQAPGSTSRTKLQFLSQGVARRTRTPLVVVLIHGAPLDVEWLHSSPRVGAILSAWTPGQARLLCAVLQLTGVACFRPEP